MKVYALFEGSDSGRDLISIHVTLKGAMDAGEQYRQRRLRPLIRHWLRYVGQNGRRYPYAYAHGPWENRADDGIYQNAIWFLPVEYTVLVKPSRVTEWAVIEEWGVVL